jgi:hypothetical protein
MPGLSRDSEMEVWPEQRPCAYPSPASNGFALQQAGAWHDCHPSRLFGSKGELIIGGAEGNQPMSILMAG